MKLDSLFRWRGALAAASAIALAAGILTFPAKADQWDRKTILTVNQTIQVRDTVLDPGQYVLKLADSSSDRHIVQIFNADQSRIIDTILAIPKQRMEPTGDSQFTFWETPPGTARALRAWFYPGDTIGQEFPYPKHLQEIAMVTTSSAPTVVPEPSPVPEAVTTEPAQPEEQPEASGMTEEPIPQEQPVEMAQNSPPPEPAAAPAPEPAPPEAPAELPKTASPYPLIGLSGLALLAASGLLKLKRSW
jgi:LPXTG-motif cell wall-anchored protein